MREERAERTRANMWGYTGSHSSSLRSAVRGVRRKEAPGPTWWLHWLERKKNTCVSRKRPLFKYWVMDMWLFQEAWPAPQKSCTQNACVYRPSWSAMFDKKKKKGNQRREHQRWHSYWWFFMLWSINNSRKSQMWASWTAPFINCCIWWPSRPFVFHHFF